MNTQDCIANAFAGESQANRKYKSFAEAAADEGYDQVAKLFRATSAAEEIHARRLLRVGGYIGTTVANLEAGREGELYERIKFLLEYIEVSCHSYFSISIILVKRPNNM